METHNVGSITDVRKSGQKSCVKYSVFLKVVSFRFENVDVLIGGLYEIPCSPHRDLETEIFRLVGVRVSEHCCCEILLYAAALKSTHL